MQKQALDYWHIAIHLKYTSNIYGLTNTAGAALPWADKWKPLLVKCEMISQHVGLQQYKISTVIAVGVERKGL